MTQDKHAANPAGSLDDVLDEVWEWLADNGHEPGMMYSGDILMVDAAWKAAIASAASRSDT